MTYTIYNVLTIGTPSQSRANVMAWVAFSRGVSGDIVYASGQRPGAVPSTRAAIIVPSFQSVVKLVTLR